MKIRILKPRLDVTFKKGPVPHLEGPIPPIRSHWKIFVDNLFQYHQKRQDEIEIVEKPLWKFSLEEVQKLSNNVDLIYIPHKQKVDFDVGLKGRYYMQTVFPHLFTVDYKGWGANLSWAPLNPMSYHKSMDNVFFEYKERIENNSSKFDQPKRKRDFPYKNYFLFLCQIPHDETITYHSDVSVKEALKATLSWAKEEGQFVLVKGHPVNKKSMEPLSDLCYFYPDNCKYVEDVSIHQCIENCIAAFTVNSGSGFEVILHERPLLTFGRAEYNSIIPKVKPDNESINQGLKYKFQINRYISFIATYIHFCVNSSDPRTFTKSRLGDNSVIFS